MNPVNLKRIDIIGLFIFSFVFTLCHLHKFFFWDTIIQISIPANWYFENNFNYFFLPDNIATGHPPFVAMYIAFLWKIFKRSLIISHLAMFPFVFGIAFQSYKLISQFDIKRTHIFVILIFVLLDPTIISQLSLITFDLVQIFFFLWSINNMLTNKKLFLSISFTGLLLSSLRGVISGIGLIVFAVIFCFLKKEKLKIKTFSPFIPGLVAIACFLFNFYIHKHWIVHNTVSNSWSESAVHANFSEAIRNMGILIWRLIDFGRIGIWIMISYILYKIIKTGSMFDNNFKILFFISITQLLVFLPITIIYKYPFAHRYLLPVIIPATIAAIYWLLKYAKYYKFIIPVIFICLISGYFWIYPDKIAKGWDATPAHWHYYSLRKQMITFLDHEKIDISQVGSAFPNLSEINNIDLNNDPRKFIVKDLQRCKYILYSNIFNDFTGVEIDELSSTWTPVKVLKCRGVYMILYKKP